MLKVGNIVKTVLEIRNNPVVAESRGWHPVPRHSIGVVVAVRETILNGYHNMDGSFTTSGNVYVDVHIFDDGTGKAWKAGNYHSGSFEKIL